MNKNLIFLVFSMSIVGAASAEDLEGSDTPTYPVDSDRADIGEAQACAQPGIDGELRIRAEAKDSLGSDRDGDRIDEAVIDGEVASFGSFLACWWARDLEGDDTTFTGPCWDRHIGGKDEGTQGSDSRDRSESTRV